MTGINFTDREVVLLKAVMSHGKVEVNDWEAVANTAEFSTAKYARDTWTVMKKKISAAVGVDPDAPPAPKTPRKTTSPRKRKVAAATDGDDTEEPGSASPKKKNCSPRKTAAKKQPVPEPEALNDADGENQAPTTSTDKKEDEEMSGKTKVNEGDAAGDVV